MSAITVDSRTHELPSRNELEDLKVALEVVMWVILYLGNVGILSTKVTGIASIYVFLSRWEVQRRLDLGKPAKTTAEKVEQLVPTLELLGGVALATLHMTDRINSDLYLWIFFGSQLTLMSATQIAKRISGDERYQKQQDNTKKYLEDSKFFLENIAIWTIMLLGSLEIINTHVMGYATIAIFGARAIMEYKLSKMDKSPSKDTATKIAKLIPYLEIAVGITLSILLLTGTITPDDDIWYFFGTQLFLMIAAQMAKRCLESKEEETASVDQANSFAPSISCG